MSGTVVATIKNELYEARKLLVAQARTAPFNYLVLQLAFGSLTHAQEMRSLSLFASEVMPALEPVAA